ncbi:MAG: HAD family hydrolase [Chloroflexales bacterium]|nr:HAD family hydrolase [Chloroflexales bacterium]
MRTRAVIFDRDLTLTYVAPSDVARLHARLAAMTPGLSLAALQGAWERWPGPWPRTAGDEQAFWERFCLAFSADHGFDSTLAVALAVEMGEQYPTMFSAYPDAPPAVAALRNAGLGLAVLTNFELPGVAQTLAHAGLDPAAFATILNAGMIGYAKPDPRAFHAAADALGLPPALCCFVDDLAENVTAARSIGMQAYQIDRSRPGLAPGGRIGSLLDLIGLLSSPDDGPEPRPFSPEPYDMTA